MSGTFNGVGALQFTPDNKHAYLYTGERNIKSSDGDKEFINFTTTSEYMIAKFQPYYSTFNQGDNLQMKLNFNGVLIYSEELEFSEGYSDNISTIIIPPFTNVQATLISTVSGVGINVGIALVADVKGTIEQFNLEVINE